MTGLQNIQSPLGALFPALQPRAARRASAPDIDEGLLLHNHPTAGSALESLRNLRTQNLVLIEVTAPGADHTSWQDFFRSRQPEFVFLQVPHHGAAVTFAPAVLEPQESAELNWLRDNREQMAQWRGQWLLIAENRLVAHSANFREIRNAIAENHLASPFTYYVPTEEETTFTLL
jgi:hypothetical protein